MTQWQELTLFGTKAYAHECGSGGDCLFQSIAFALNCNLGSRVTAHDVRVSASAVVETYTEQGRKHLLECIQAADPYTTLRTSSVQELQSYITNPHVWGTQIVFMLLSSSQREVVPAILFSDIGFICVDTMSRVHCTMAPKKRLYVPLLYILARGSNDGVHFQALGFPSTSILGMVQTVFFPHQLPVCFISAIGQYCKSFVA